MPDEHCDVPTAQELWFMLRRVVASRQPYTGPDLLACPFCSSIYVQDDYIDHDEDCLMIDLEDLLQRQPPLLEGK